MCGIILCLFSNGCASLFSRDPGKPPERILRFDLRGWPYTEYWTGIVFNGAKIGYSHVSILPADMDGLSDGEHFDILSELVLRFRSQTSDKKVVFRSHDRVASNLSLIRFSHSYDTDDSNLALSGEVVGDRLSVELRTRNRIDRRDIPLDGPLYPTSAINLLPLLHGLELDRQYRYLVYDGQTQTVSPAVQDILAYEESDLFEGRAYRIRTALLGQEINTWMDLEGRPLIEMSLDGVMVAGLESEIDARNYLLAGAANKSDVMLDFSLFKKGKAIEERR